MLPLPAIVPLRRFALSLFAAAAAAAPSTGQTPVVTASGETMRIASSGVQSLGANRFRVTLVMDDDNGNGSLPTSYRRWWHAEIANLNPTVATTLEFRVTNAGYSDVILPVWSRLPAGSGTSWNAYERLPTSATPAVNGSTHAFTVTVPLGIAAIRLAKYFPYSVTDKDAYLASLASRPRAALLRSTRTLGTSWQGRPIEMLELTDSTVPDADKRRVWIHSGIHPAETTSYFVVEGLVDFLLSGDLAAERLLDELIVTIVPMANPDGVFLGNYRTNARSVNLEEQWTAPYASPEREVIALQTEIERLMGSPSTPGAKPIEFLLNLHSTHNIAFPFHFRHVSNPNFHPVLSPSGVIPTVHLLETTWITAFRAASPFTARGSSRSSTLGAPRRPFVESMLHDRWTIAPGWLTGGQRAVMAITYEGTYGRGPDGVTWNTPDDFRTNGRELAFALGDYFDILPGTTFAGFGTGCGGVSLGFPMLTGRALTAPDRVELTSVGAQPLAPAWLVLGTDRVGQVLPAPPSCLLRTTPIVALGGTVDASGRITQTLTLPPTLAFDVVAQHVVADLTTTPRLAASNALAITRVP